MASRGHARFPGFPLRRDRLCVWVKRRGEPLAHESLPLRAIEENGVANVVFPKEGRPHEGDTLGRHRGATALGLADGAYPPGAILRAPGGFGIDADVAVGGMEDAFPGAKLVKARGVHHGPGALE